MTFSRRRSLCGGRADVTPLAIPPSRSQAEPDKPSHDKQTPFQRHGADPCRPRSQSPPMIAPPSFAGHRPSRRRRLPSRPPGCLCRRLPGGGRDGWGIVGVSLRSPDTRDALAPQDGLYTLAVSEQRRRTTARHRLDPVDAGGAGGSRRGAGRADRSAHPHRHADDHRKGLSEGSRRRPGRRPSRHRPRSGESRIAEDRAWVPGRGAGAPPRRRHATLHRALLRQPPGQRRHAAPAAGRVRRAARCRSSAIGRCLARRPYRRRGRFPVEHGRPHRAGDHRCRPGADRRRARHRGRLAGDDRAVLPMGDRGPLPGRTTGLGKVRRHHGRRCRARSRT